jgi:6-pyruvoyl-tetrahydropterin synthase
MTQSWTSEKSGGAEQRMRIASKGRVLTGVKSHFSAAHRCPQTKQIHGHTWEVTVWFNNPCRCDARVFKAQVENDLAQWDHGILPDEFAWAEDICLDLAKRLDVVRVEVSRPNEGLLAAWELTQ